MDMIHMDFLHQQWIICMICLMSISIFYLNVHIPCMVAEGCSISRLTLGQRQCTPWRGSGLSKGQRFGHISLKFKKIALSPGKGCDVTVAMWEMKWCWAEGSQMWERCYLFWSGSVILYKREYWLQHERFRVSITDLHVFVISVVGCMEVLTPRWIPVIPVIVSSVCHFSAYSLMVSHSRKFRRSMSKETEKVGTPKLFHHFIIK